MKMRNSLSWGEGGSGGGDVSRFTKCDPTGRAIDGEVIAGACPQDCPDGGGSVG